MEIEESDLIGKTPEQIEQLKKQQMELRKQQSTPISIPDNNPNSKEYNNF